MKRSLLTALSFAFLNTRQVSDACEPEKRGAAIPAGPCFEETVEDEQHQVTISELATFCYEPIEEFYEFPGEVSRALTPETRADHQTVRCAYQPPIRRFLLYAERGRVTAAYRVNFRVF